MRRSPVRFRPAAPNHLLNNQAVSPIHKVGLFASWCSCNQLCPRLANTRQAALGMQNRNSRLRFFDLESRTPRKVPPRKTGDRYSSARNVSSISKREKKCRNALNTRPCSRKSRWPRDAHLSNCRFTVTVLRLQWLCCRNNRRSCGYRCSNRSQRNGYRG